MSVAMSYNNHSNQKYHPYSFRSGQSRHGYYRMNQIPIQQQQPPVPIQTLAQPTIQTTISPLQPQVPPIQQAHVYYQPCPPQQYYTYVQPQGEGSLPSNQHRKTKHFSTWTPAEDKLLRELKEEQKMGWKQILTYLNERTPNACQFRWRRVVGNISISNTSVAALPPSYPRASSSRSRSLMRIDSPMTSPKISNAQTAEPEFMEPTNATNTTADTNIDSSPISERRKSSHHSINFLLN